MWRKFLANQVKMGLKKSALITIKNVHIKLAKSEKEKSVTVCLLARKVSF